jgi:hypothetical protein
MITTTSKSWKQKKIWRLIGDFFFGGRSVFTYEAKDTVYQVGLVKAKPGKKGMGEYTVEN